MTMSDLLRPLRASRLAVVAAVSLAALPAAADAARRPPLPAGAVELAPGHVPAVCAGTFDAYNVNFGYYWSKSAKAWVQAPRCYPRWGYLSASASQVVRAGQKVTVTAVSTTNSAEYAPEAKAIAWTYPGKRVAGCGSADLSCTVIPAKKETREWQWGLFHVAMPSQFRVDFPSEFCAGQHLCAGVTTQAWTYAGVPPKGAELPVNVSGVLRRGCDAGACSRLPIRGATVTATSSKGVKRTTRSGSDGSFTFKLKPATWTVSTSIRGVEVTPAKRSVKVAKRDIGGQDFKGCLKGLAAGKAAARAAAQGKVVFVGTQQRTCGTAKHEDLSSTIAVGNTEMRGIFKVAWSGSAWCMGGSVGSGDYGSTFSLATRPANPIVQDFAHGVRTFTAPYSYIDTGRDYTGKVEGFLSPSTDPKKGSVINATVDFGIVGSSTTCTASAKDVGLKPAM